MMHLDENDMYVVRKGGEHTATSKKRGCENHILCRETRLISGRPTETLSVTLYKPATIARYIYCDFKKLHKVSLNQRHMHKRGQIISLKHRSEDDSKHTILIL